MKKMLVVVVAVLLACGLLVAQQGDGQHRRGHQYDATKEKTYTGVVEALPEQGKRGGIQFKAGGVCYRLHPGPKDWLAGKGITLKVGDTITVVGVAHTGQRGSFLNARTIKSGDKTVQLRGADGKPLYPRPPRPGKGPGPGDKDGDGD